MSDSDRVEEFIDYLRKKYGNDVDDLMLASEYIYAKLESDDLLRDSFTLEEVERCKRFLSRDQKRLNLYA